MGSSYTFQSFDNFNGHTNLTDSNVREAVVPLPLPSTILLGKTFPVEYRRKKKSAERSLARG